MRVKTFAKLAKKVPVVQVADAARKALYTGHIGDGKIFVCGVEQAVKVRTNEQGYDALHGEEEKQLQGEGLLPLPCGR